MTDREELKRLAGKVKANDDIGYMNQQDWYDFHAEATPSTILDLLAQLEAKEAEIAGLHEARKQASRANERLVDELSALRASRDADIERAIHIVESNADKPLYEIVARLSQMKEPK